MKINRRACWEHLVEEVDKDLWVRGYHLVIGKLRGPGPWLLRVVEWQFSTHVTRKPRDNEVDQPDVVLFTLECPCTLIND